EEDGQLRVQDVEQERLGDDALRTCRGWLLVNGKRLFVAPRRVRQIEQICHAGKFESLKGDGTHVEDCGEPDHGCQEVRKDASCAAEGGKDARLLAAKKPRRNGEEDTGAGN